MQLSAKTQALRESLHRWLETFPAGAVRMTEDFYEPSSEDYDYYVELKISLLPVNKNYSKIIIFSTPDSIGLIIDKYKRIAEREDLVVPWFVGCANWGCIASEPWTALTNERMLEVCEAVAQGRIDLKLGIIFRRIICAQAKIDLPSTFSITDGVSYLMMPLFKWLSNYGFGEVRSVEFEPWANAAERHP